MCKFYIHVRVHVQYSIFSCTIIYNFNPAVTSSGLNELQIAFVCRETLKVINEQSIFKCVVCIVGDFHLDLCVIIL